MIDRAIVQAAYDCLPIHVFDMIAEMVALPRTLRVTDAPWWHDAALEHEAQCLYEALKAGLVWRVQVDAAFARQWRCKHTGACGEFMDVTDDDHFESLLDGFPAGSLVLDYTGLFKGRPGR
jgi:hypothetical protein